MLNIVICDDDTDFREIVEYKVRNCLAGFFETDYNIQIVSGHFIIKASGRKTHIIHME